MNRLAAILIFSILSIPIVSLDLPAQTPAKPLTLFAGSETLKYRLLWPSGVSLGEAVFVATIAHDQLRLELTMDADLPIHNISGSMTSIATRDGLCSIESHKKFTEGTRTSEESVEFDQKNHTARRTAGASVTTVPIPECVRDPLLFLYYFRNQLAAGSPATTATLFLAPGKSVEILSAGKGAVTVGGQKRNAEKYRVAYGASNLERSFEVSISSDMPHMPLTITFPSALAVFSAELE